MIIHESWIVPDRSYSFDESGGRKRVEDVEFKKIREIRR